MMRTVLSLHKNLLQKTMLVNGPCSKCCSSSRLFSFALAPSKNGDSDVSIDSRLSPFVDIANKFCIHTRMLQNAVEVNPYILRIHPEQFCKTCDLLSGFGFKPEFITELIKSKPQIFSLPYENLQNCLLQWLSVRIDGDVMIDILSNNPFLIDDPNVQYRNRIKNLLPYLNSYKNVGNLILKTPNVLFDDWGTLKAKLAFLRNLYVTPNQIVQSSAMKLDFIEIKKRYKLLELAGIYKEFDPENKLRSKNNPFIERILGTSAKVFAESVVGIELEEYEAFSELYELESREEEVDDSDSE